MGAYHTLKILIANSETNANIVLKHPIAFKLTSGISDENY